MCVYIYIRCIYIYIMYVYIYMYIRCKYIYTQNVYNIYVCIYICMFYFLGVLIDVSTAVAQHNMSPGWMFAPVD